MDRPRVYWHCNRSMGSCRFVLARGRGERGGAAIGEHATGSVGRCDRTVETNYAPEPGRQSDLGGEPKRALDERRKMGAGLAAIPQGLRSCEEVSADYD